MQDDIPVSAPRSTASPGDEPAIEARDLTRRFGERRAIAGLDLRVPRNARFGLVGANGAGKTTLLRMVSGALLPSAGTLRVLGDSPVDAPEAVHRRLGFVTETPRLYPELRVAGFLRFVAGARGLQRAERERAVDRELTRFDLTAVAMRLIGRLSKGTLQRVSLAQAFLHDPELLVIDEPTGGLDPHQREEVRARLRDLGEERTLLLSTHDLDEARALTSEVAVLRAGRCIGQGPSERVLGAPDILDHFAPSDAAGSDASAAGAP